MGKNAGEPLRSGASRGCDEGADLCQVFSTRRRFDPARHIHHPGPNLCHEFGDVLGSQSPRQNQPGSPFRQGPQQVQGNSSARPAGLSGHECVDQDGRWRMAKLRRAVNVGNHGLEIREAAEPEGSNDLEASQRHEVFGRFLAVKLENPETDAIRRLGDLARWTVDEETDSPARLRQGRDDLRGERGLDFPRRARIKIQADPIDPRLGAGDRVGDGGQPTDLDADRRGLISVKQVGFRRQSQTPKASRATP